MEERWSVELLECLAQKAGCGYLSDLRYLSPWEQFHLSRELLHVPSEAFSLKTWNDALAYLTGLSQQAGCIRRERNVDEASIGTLQRFATSSEPRMNLNRKVVRMLCKLLL